jgi:hypothetical protein
MSHPSAPIQSLLTSSNQQSSFTHHVSQSFRNVLALLNSTLKADDDSESEEETVVDANELSSAPSSDDEEEDKENIPPTPSWTTTITPVSEPVFNYPSGAQLHQHHAQTELEIFMCLLRNETIDIIVNNTNAYAYQKLGTNTWSTTRKEMWLFIAVNIFMGINYLPQVHMYWQKSWRQQFVINAFTQQRFFQLLRFFHIAPPTPPNTRHTVVDKILPLITACQHTFSTQYLPSQVLVVDESMVAFKGRDQLKQYIKSKPTRWGYKVWCISSDSYLLNFEVYTGSLSNALLPAGHSSIHQTVIRLARPYFNHNHILYVDNLFTSPLLFNELKRNGMNACGTLRPNRKHLPADLKSISKRLPKGSSYHWQQGDLGCLAWNDRRLVYFLANHTTINQTVMLDARGPGQNSAQITKPKVVHDYNLHRGGVDTIDQLHGNYSIGRKSKKNWPSLAWWLIDMCIVNSYMLYVLQSRSTTSHLDFRIALMQQIVAENEPRQQYDQHAPQRRAFRRFRPHYPIAADRRGQCHYCTHTHRRRRRTRISCDNCLVHLCVEPCFKQHHVDRD